MLYDNHHVFINGDSFKASGLDKKLIKKLTNSKSLTTANIQALGVDARGLVSEWYEAGWLYTKAV
jgi:50S ribosomal protein L16 3-hydroxylase